VFRIVIAEPDDALSVWLAGAFSPEQGFEVVGRAHDARSALEMARRTHINAVLVDVDIVMPPHNGLTLVAAIRDAMPETLVLVLAVEAVPETAQAAFAAGAAGVFAKDGSAQILRPGLAASYPGEGWDEPLASTEKPLPLAAHQMAPTGRVSAATP
jgi:DNA-binding NarL/FixJ family response regulator